MGMSPNFYYWVGINLQKLYINSDYEDYKKLLEKFENLANLYYIDYCVHLFNQSDERIGFGITILTLDWNDGVRKANILEEKKDSVTEAKSKLTKVLELEKLDYLVNLVDVYCHLDYS